MTWPVNDRPALTEVSAYAATGPVGVITDSPAILRRVLTPGG